MSSLARAAEAMRAKAQEMAATAERTRALAQRTADGASGTARDMGSVAAAAEELSASINEIGQQVTRATAAVRSTMDRAAVTDAKVDELAKAAERVGDVVRLISSIAGQTNLLALNATIEAARAGEVRQGLRGGRRRSEGAGGADRQGNRGDRRPDPGNPGRHHRCGGSGTRRYGSDRPGGRGRLGDCHGGGGARRDDARDCRQRAERHDDGAGHDSGDARCLGQLETASAASHSVLDDAANVGRTADLLETELKQFLTAMARTDEAERRRYERIPGRELMAQVQFPGSGATRLPIRDISRGGVGLGCDRTISPGTEAWLTLPGTTRLWRHGPCALTAGFWRSRSARTRRRWC